MIGTGKKFLAGGFLALLVALSFGLVGCGGSDGSANSEVVGTWTLSSMEMDGVELPEETISQYLSSLGEDNITITFEEDGTTKISFASQDSGNAKYTYENGKGTIEDTGNGTLDYVIEDGKLKMTTDGSTLVFTKN